MGTTSQLKSEERSDATRRDEYDDFKAFYQSFDIPHFSASEIWSPMLTPGNSTPPRVMWGNIIPNAVIASKIRQAVNFPVFITSSGRSDSYNASLPNSGEWSRHRLFAALDLSGGSFERDKLIFEAARAIRAKKEFLETKSGAYTIMYPVYPRSWPLDQIVPSRQAMALADGGKTTSKFIWNGGIGRGIGFTHIDDRGEDVSWGYSS